MLTKVMGLELGPHKVCLIIIQLLPECSVYPHCCVQSCNVDSSEQCESYCGDDRYGEVGLVRP